MGREDEIACVKKADVGYTHACCLTTLAIFTIANCKGEVVGKLSTQAILPSHFESGVRIMPTCTIDAMQPVQYAREIGREGIINHKLTNQINAHGKQ